jgi:hypothetical protein
MVTLDKLAYWKARSIIDPTTNCWVWQGATACGYPYVTRASKTYRGNRLCYMDMHGEIPKGLQVLHSCDNPTCVNPEHLHLGTPWDNMLEREARKRNTYHVGSAHVGTKFIEADVLAIRAAYPATSMRQLAKQYKVGDSTIQRIIHRVNWRHI